MADSSPARASTPTAQCLQSPMAWLQVDSPPAPSLAAQLLERHRQVPAKAATNAAPADNPQAAPTAAAAKPCPYTPERPQTPSTVALGTPPAHGDFRSADKAFGDELVDEIEDKVTDIVARLEEMMDMAFSVRKKLRTAKKAGLPWLLACEKPYLACEAIIHEIIESASYIYQLKALGRLEEAISFAELCEFAIWFKCVDLNKNVQPFLKDPTLLEKTTAAQKEAESQSPHDDDEVNESCTNLGGGSCDVKEAPVAKRRRSVVAAEAEPKADSAVVPKGKGGTKGTRAPKALGVKPKAKSGIKRRREEHNDGADEDGAERKRRQWIRQSKFIQQLFGYGDQGKGQKGQRQGHV